MPRGDRTGPEGAGTMSGRRMGFCAGNSIPGFQNNETFYSGRGGYGFQHRFGGGGNRRNAGYGFRHWKGLFPSEPVNAKSELEAQMEYLKKQLSEVENQIKNLN